VQQSQSIATLHLRDPIGYVCSDTFFFIPARAFGAWQESSRMTYTPIRLSSYSGSCILSFYRSKGTEHLINLSQTYGSLSFLLPPSCQYLSGFLHLNLSRRGQGYCVKKPSTPHAHDLRDRPPATFVVFFLFRPSRISPIILCFSSCPPACSSLALTCHDRRVDQHDTFNRLT